MAWSLPNELNGDEKKSEQVMRFVTYGATPGLEQFPKGERFGRWRAIHRELMSEDAGYRKRIDGAYKNIIWVTLVFVPASVVLGRLGGSRLALKWSVGLTVALTVLYVVHVALAAFRIQNLMNEGVGRVLVQAPRPKIQDPGKNQTSNLKGWG